MWRSGWFGIATQQPNRGDDTTIYCPGWFSGEEEEGEKEVEFLFSIFRHCNYGVWSAPQQSTCGGAVIQTIYALWRERGREEEGDDILLLIVH